MPADKGAVRGLGTGVRPRIVVADLGVARTVVLRPGSHTVGHVLCLSVCQVNDGCGGQDHCVELFQVLTQKGSHLVTVRW